MNQNNIIQIGFLIFPGFPMACLTSMIEPLRAANEIAGKTAFGWNLVSEDGKRVQASANVPPVSGKLSAALFFSNFQVGG